MGSNLAEMPRTMKLLIYTHEFPPFRGGAGVYSYDLAVGLMSLGLEVHVLAPLPKPAQRTLAETARIEHLAMHYVTEWQASPAAEQLLLGCLQLRHEFDMVMVTERRAQEIVATMGKCSFRYIAVIHGTELLDYFGGKRFDLAIQPQRMAQFYERAEFCIAVSHATSQLAKVLLKNVRIKLVTIQNGVNLARLPPPRLADSGRLRQRYGTGAEIVFCLGRLDLDKGQDVLIKAFRKVRNKRPWARLLIGGTGPYGTSLDELRSALELDDCVELLGEISSAELPAYFELCDVFALTSRSENRWEGFGLVYLEAGYYGKAVLGGNEGGVPEAICDKVSGIVVASRDEESIAAAITTLLDDKALCTRMGKQGRQRVLSYFNSSRMASETLGHIIRALHNKPSLSSRYERTLLAWSLLGKGFRTLASKILQAIRSRFLRTSIGQ